MKKIIDLTEINKLEEFLKNNNFKYERIDKEHYWPGGEDFHQLLVNEDDGSWDVICHCWSYGGPEGLLEIYGRYIEDEEEVEGYLTADEIIRRIKKEKEILV